MIHWCMHANTYVQDRWETGGTPNGSYISDGNLDEVGDGKVGDKVGHN